MLKICNLKRSLYHDALRRLYKNHRPSFPVAGIRTTQILGNNQHHTSHHIIRNNYQPLLKPHSKMKQSIIFSILSMALAVSASPTSGGGQCNGGSNKQVCCNGVGGLNLVCVVQALGGACDGSKNCCSTEAATVSIPLTVGRTLQSLPILK